MLVISASLWYRWDFSATNYESLSFQEPIEWLSQPGSPTGHMTSISSVWKPWFHHILIPFTAFCVKRVRFILTLQGTKIVLTDITGYSRCPYWCYRVQPLALTDITGYSHCPYWHYRIQPLSPLSLQGTSMIQTEITGHTRVSLLHDGDKGLCWHYRVQIRVLANILGFNHISFTGITGYRHGSLLILQGKSTSYRGHKWDPPTGHSSQGHTGKGQAMCRHLRLIHGNGPTVTWYQWQFKES